MRIWNLELGRVPYLELRDELLLDQVNLLLSLRELSLFILKNAEVVTVCLLEVFHLAEHHELLLINDFLGGVFEHVFLLQLLIAKSHLSLLFFLVKANFEGVDLALVLVDRVSEGLDSGPARLGCLAVLANPLFQSLAFGAVLEL